jgi:hypothetical protein
MKLKPGRLYEIFLSELRFHGIINKSFSKIEDIDRSVSGAGMAGSRGRGAGRH